MIRFTDYGVIAEKPRVGQLGPIFPCTMKEKLYVRSKNGYLLFDRLDELYHRAKFGEDRTTRAGCRCENMVFVCLFVFSVTLRSRSAVPSTVTYFEQVLCRGLWIDFDDALIPFFSIDCRFKGTR